MTAIGLYRVLLRRLRPGLHRRHGPEMEAVFAELLDEARPRGRLAVSRVLARSLVDLVRIRWPGVRPTGGVMAWLGSGVDAARQDLWSGWRALTRSPGLSAAAVITLGLGIGAITAVFSVVNGVVLRPLPYEDPDRLVVLYNQYPTLDVERGAQSPGDLGDYQDRAERTLGHVSVSMFPQTLIEGGVPRRVDVAVVTPGFFDLMGVSLAMGRDITPDDDHDVALVSDEYWRTRLGADADVIGTTLAFDGQPKTIIGVLPAGFRVVAPPDFGVPPSPIIWTPIPAQGWGRDTRDRTAHWMHIVARLAPGATLGQAQQEMDAIAAWQRTIVPRRAEREARIQVTPLHDEVVRGVKPPLLALLWAAALVLVVACVNVANLLLVRAQGRREEMTVRKALGGGAARVIRQLLTEGAILGVTGAAVGIVFATLGVDLILALEPGALPRVDEVGLDRGVLGFVAALIVAATLMFSAAPAWQGARTPDAEVLRSGGRSGTDRRGRRLASALIVAEVALSLVLLAGGGLLMRSVTSLLAVDPGFETQGVLTFEAPLPGSRFREPTPATYTGPPQRNPVRTPYYAELERRLAELPGVTSVGAVFPVPLGGRQSGSTYALPGTEGEEEAQIANSHLVTPTYFETVGIPLVEGRTFLPEDDGDELVVSRTMAERLWPGRSALGQRLEVGWWSGAVWGEVVGVVEDVRTQEITDDDAPTIYRLGVVYAYSPMTLVVRVQGDPMAVLEPVRAAVTALDPSVPVIEPRPLAELVDAQTAPTRFLLALVGVFAVLALVLAAIGLYGVISFAVGRRIREFGIRIALGAERAHVFGLVVRTGVGLVGLGALLGLGGAVAVRGAITPFLFGVQALDPPTLAGTTLVLLAVAAVACAVPALRATRVDPVESLRVE